MRKTVNTLLLTVLCVGALFSQTSINGSRVTQGTRNYVTGGGTAQAQTATYSPAITALTVGLQVCWLPNAANTAAAPTLAVNGLTATTITKLGHTALIANDLTTTAVACAFYDGTDFQLQNPQAANYHAASIPLSCVAGSGSGTTYTCTTAPSLVPVAGDEILFKADLANSGAATLNVDSAGASAIDKQGCGTALVANDLLANQWTLLVYTGTVWCMPGLGNAPGGGGSFVLLMELTANNSGSSLQFITRNVAGQSGAMFQNDYDDYECDVVGLIPANNAVQIVGNFGVGASFDTMSNYGWAGWRTAGSGGSAVSGNDSTTSFGLDAAGGVSNSATAGAFSATVKIFGPTNGTFFPRYTVHSSYNNGSTNIMATMSGVYSVATAATSWEVRAASGNLVSGNARCYGIAK